MQLEVTTEQNDVVGDLVAMALDNLLRDDDYEMDAKVVLVDLLRKCIGNGYVPHFGGAIAALNEGN